MNIQTITLQYDGKTITLPINKTQFFDELYVDVYTKIERGGTRLSISLHPKKPLILSDLRVVFSINAPQNSNVFCNGWQSWTESREFALTERIQPLSFLARPFLSAMGDYSFYKYPQQKGKLHSWSYTYLRSSAHKSKNTIALTASLNENLCFTVFEWDDAAQTLTARKDLNNLMLEHSFPLLDLWYAEGEEQQLFDTFFQLNDTKPCIAPAPINGWTSWYYHYTKINERVIKDNLAAFAEQKNNTFLPADNSNTHPSVFQIDDGWQTAVGDWLSVKPDSFPDGMASIADDIRSRNMTPGLWLAPFICANNSLIFKTKKDWLLTDDGGKPVVAGYNPLWSGWFYALDLYNMEVQGYLRQVLQVMQYKWGFSLLKLDFLYAACLYPPKNKTRGQVMHEAMDFLRSIIGTPNQILACGVPLAAAFGRADYCRIGADVHSGWEHSFLRFINGRERVSTVLSLQNTIGRRHLDGRAFRNDPDVAVLRSENTKLTITQKNTLFIINTLLGSVVFISDNTDNYIDNTKSQFGMMEFAQQRTVQKVVTDKDYCEINFTVQNKKYTAFCNLSANKRTTFSGKRSIVLQPHESIIV